MISVMLLVSHSGLTFIRLTEITGKLENLMNQVTHPHKKHITHISHTSPQFRLFSTSPGVHLEKKPLKQMQFIGYVTPLKMETSLTF